MRLAAAFVVAVAATASAQQAAAPQRVRVEYIDDPRWALIDTPKPRFSWVPQLAAGTTQAAYQVQVVETFPTAGKTLWDSGKTTSPESINVEYGGVGGLAPMTEASVRVMVWDSAGTESAWSADLPFVVGPSAAEDWNGAAWIGCDQTGEMNVTAPAAARNRLRAEVPLPAGKKVAHARLFVAGTGFYRVFVNGGLAGKSETRINPGWTGFRQRVRYTTEDITALVAASSSSLTVGIELGNGWADVLPAPWNGTVHHGAVPWARGGALRKAVAQVLLTMSDGSTATVVTGAPGAPAVAFASGDASGRGLVEVAAAESAGASRAARGLVLSSNWTCGGGPRVNDSVYDGETFDARRQQPGWSKAGYAPSGPVAGTWGKAVAAWPFASSIVLSAQAMPSSAVQREFTGTINRTADPAPGSVRYVFDFKQNMAGATRLTVPPGTPAGTAFSIVHAEALMHPPYGPVDGTLYVGNLRSALQTDTYIHDGSTASHEFGEATFHGFRYAQVTVSGYGSGKPAPVLTASSLTGVHFRSDIKLEGSFFAGDEGGLFNAIHHAAQWVEADNLQSVPSDCDQRDERKGWMGDAALSTESFFLNFDMPAFYTMWVQNMHDSQMNPFQPAHGNSVGDTTPLTFGSAPGDPSWQTAYPTAITEMLHYANDQRMAQGYFDSITGYISDLSAAADKSGLGKMFAHYGEWVTPPALPTSVNSPTQGPKPPTSLVSAFNFILDLGRAEELATAVGNTSFAAWAKAQGASRREEFVKAFWVPSIGAFGNSNKAGLQVSNALALALGALPGVEQATYVKSLLEDIQVTHGGHHAVGITGSKFLWRDLVDVGQEALALNLTLATDYPSYGFMIKGGPDGYEPATTLWELWTAPLSGPGMNSRAHHMFSSIELFFYNYVAGISQLCGGGDASTVPTTHTYSCVAFNPRITSDARLPWANATIPTLRGPASISWARGSGGSKFTLTATLPVGGSTGEVTVPVDDPATATVTVGGATVWSHGSFTPTKGVTAGKAGSGSVVFSVGPGGSFTFQAA